MGRRELEEARDTLRDDASLEVGWDRVGVEGRRDVLMVEDIAGRFSFRAGMGTGAVMFLSDVSCATSDVDDWVSPSEAPLDVLRDDCMR